MHVRSTILLASALLLASCGSAAPVPVDDNSAASSAQASVQSGESASAAADLPRVVTITAERWKFTPSVLKLKKGEKTFLQLKGINGVHGFAVPDLGINLAVEEGQTVTVEIPTGAAGTFSFFCSIPCGEGHKDMRGQIIIEE